MRTKIIILLFVLANLATACKEDSFTSYSDQARIYFYFENILGVEEKETIPLTHTFIYQKEEITTDTVWITVKSMGFPSQIDRLFEIETVESKSDIEHYFFSDTKLDKEPLYATNNVHFKSTLDNDIKSNFVMKAGEIYARVPFILLRDPSLRSETRYITIKIRDNENFKGGVIEKNKFILSIVDKYIKPSKWNYIEHLFGSYSDEKLKFIVNNSTLKLTDDYIVDMSKAETISYQRLFSSLVNEINKNKPKSEWLVDENGYLIDFNDRGTPVLRPKK